MTKVDISDCSGDTCVIHKGKDLVFDAFFTANQDTAKADIKLTAMVNGLELQVPGVESNACNHMKCPIKKGDVTEFKYSINVPRLLPDVKAEVTAQLVGEQGVLACIKIKGELKE